MRALIIGSGWYGCEAATSLRRMGVDFDIIDRNNDFFMGSSSNNQNRLHFGGFHYCRSHATRVECRRGYDVFMERYPRFSRRVDSYYLIASKSILDFETYLAIFLHESSPFLVESVQDLVKRGIVLNPNLVDGNRVILAKERWIDFKSIRLYFKKEFIHNLLPYDESKLYISPDKNVITFDNSRYDIVFDTTYGKLFPLDESVFELCLTLIYKRIDKSQKNSPSLTVVDGDFFSLYPYDFEKNLFTLTHVRYTPLIVSHEIETIEGFERSLVPKLISDRKKMIEEDVTNFWKNFLDTHDYVDYFVSTKTKFKDVDTGDRSMRTQRRGNVVSMCGGKITGVFDVQDVVENAISSL